MSFHTLKQPLIYVSILLFTVNQIIERVFNYYIPFIHSYLDDLLCIPIVLGFGMQILQWIHPLKDLYFLDRVSILISVIFYCILFEGILPIMNSAIYTADWIDVVMYSVGAILFYKLVIKKVKDEYLELLKSL